MLSKLLYYFLFVFFISASFNFAYGQVLNYETKIKINSDGVKKTEKIILIQINNKDENRLSHVELQHKPNQKFIFGYAHILDKDGNILRKLKKKELITRSNFSNQTFYQDNLITEFDLYWNQYPYRIKYSYTIEEEEYLYIAWWTPLVINNTRTILSSLEVDLPADLKFKIYNSNNVIFNESELNNRKKLSWTSYIAGKQKNEIYAPALEKLIPIVKVIPNDFKYGVSGTTNSWSSFGLWLDELNSGTKELTLQEKWVIEKLVDGIKERKEIIKTIYHYLQDHTTYVNVSIDIGGLKSFPATYVCKNKYGDCKALSTYMQAALKSVGIKSFYTIIKAGEKNTGIDTDIPSQQFNHVILMVPLEKSIIWLENTSAALPFNYLGTFTQNRYALAINGENSKLVKTPKLTPNDVLQKRDYTFHIVEDTEVKINIDLVLRGKSFEVFRYYISEKDKERQNNEINKLHGIKDFNIDNWNLEGFHRDSTFLHLNIAGTSSSVLREIGSFYVINPLRIELPDFENPNERKLDVIINFPINKYDESRYNLQNFEYKEIQIPKDISIESKYGAYHAVFQKKNNELIVVEKFTLLAKQIPLANYRELYNFIDSVKKYKKKSSIIIK